MKKHIIFIFLALMSIGKLSAQEEIIYNQYHFNYYLVNPALAGAEPCTQMMLSNKMQWVGMDDFPMTQLFSVKSRVWDNIGLGGYIYNDRNGYSNRIGGQVTFAYHIPLSNGRSYSKKSSYDRQLSFGASFKLNYFSINSDLYDISDAGTDNAFINTDGIAPNANFGIYYKSYGGFLGLSLTNLIPVSPDIYGDKEDPAPLTGFFFGGYTFDLNKRSRNEMYLEPAAMLKFNTFGDIAMDINLKFGDDVNKQWGYWVQASYRHSWDSDNIQSLNLMPMAGFRIQNFQLGYAFTLDLNNLVTQSAGSHEIMIGYSFCTTKHFCR